MTTLHPLDLLNHPQSSPWLKEAIRMILDDPRDLTTLANEAKLLEIVVREYAVNKLKEGK